MYCVRHWSATTELQPAFGHQRFGHITRQQQVVERRRVHVVGERVMADVTGLEVAGVAHQRAAQWVLGRRSGRKPFRTHWSGRKGQGLVAWSWLTANTSTITTLASPDRPLVSAVLKATDHGVDQRLGRCRLAAARRRGGDVRQVVHRDEVGAVGDDLGFHQGGQFGAGGGHRGDQFRTVGARVVGAALLQRCRRRWQWRSSGRRRRRGDGRVTRLSGGGADRGGRDGDLGAAGFGGFGLRGHADRLRGGGRIGGAGSQLADQAGDIGGAPLRCRPVAAVLSAPSWNSASLPPAITSTSSSPLNLPPTAFRWLAIWVDDRNGQRAQRAAGQLVVRADRVGHARTALSVAVAAGVGYLRHRKSFGGVAIEAGHGGAWCGHADLGGQQLGPVAAGQVALIAVLSPLMVNLPPFSAATVPTL
jgi:hypothetical protein